jgi:hypothetical protein
MEDGMGDAQDRDQKKPGEQPPGKFHYNPGNMAGKTVNDATPADGARTNSDDAVADLDEDTPQRPDPAARGKA